MCGICFSRGSDHEPGCPWGNTIGVMVEHRPGEICSSCGDQWQTLHVQGAPVDISPTGFCRNSGCENFWAPFRVTASHLATRFYKTCAWSEKFLRHFLVEGTLEWRHGEYWVFTHGSRIRRGLTNFTFPEGEFIWNDIQFVD